MSENTTNKNVKDDEIDLMDLFRRMGQTLKEWMNALGRGFLISTVFLLRRWLWLTLSVILGVVISYVIEIQADKIFSSEITIRSNTVPNSDMITYINRLHTYTGEGDSIALSTALSLPLEKVRNIKDIQAFWAIDLANDGIPDAVDYKDKYDVKDTINVRMKDRFVVRMRVTDVQVFAQLSVGILDYARKNQLFQQKNQLRLTLNREIRDRLIFDIGRLDSLQKIKYFEETKNIKPPIGGQIVFLQPQNQNTQLLYSDIYTLYSRKQAIDTELELYKDVLTLLNDFTQPARPINRTLYYGKKIIPALFVLCLLSLILIDRRKIILEIFRKY